MRSLLVWMAMHARHIRSLDALGSTRALPDGLLEPAELAELSAAASTCLAGCCATAPLHRLEAAISPAAWWPHWLRGLSGTLRHLYIELSGDSPALDASLKELTALQALQVSCSTAATIRHLPTSLVRLDAWTSTSGSPGLTLAPTSTAGLPFLATLDAEGGSLPAGWLARQTSLRHLSLDQVSVVTTPGEQADLGPALAPLTQLTCLALNVLGPADGTRLRAALPNHSNLQRLFVETDVCLSLAGPSLRNLRWLCASLEVLVGGMNLLPLAIRLEQLDVLHATQEDEDFAANQGDWKALCLCVGGLQSLHSLNLYFYFSPPPPLPLWYHAKLLFLQRQRPDLEIAVRAGECFWVRCVEPSWLPGPVG